MLVRFRDEGAGGNNSQAQQLGGVGRASILAVLADGPDELSLVALVLSERIVGEQIVHHGDGAVARKDFLVLLQRGDKLGIVPGAVDGPDGLSQLGPGHGAGARTGRGYRLEQSAAEAQAGLAGAV